MSAYTLKGKLSEIVTNVGALDSAVISTYTSAITSFVDGSTTTQISTIETSVSTIANTMALEATVSTLTNNVAAVSTVISTEFASVNSDLSTMISTLATLS